MRHTLLSIPARNALRSEYKIRAGIVLCFMLSLTGIIGIAALFPAFLNAMKEKQSALTALSTTKTDAGSTVKEIEKSLALNNTLLKVLSENPGSRLSSLIMSTAGLRQSNSITSMSLSRIATTSVSIALLGTAPTREDLLAFKSRIESLIPGNKVSLPVSQLTKSKDIKYSMQFEIKLP